MLPVAIPFPRIFWLAQLSFFLLPFARAFFTNFSFLLLQPRYSLFHSALLSTDSSRFSFSFSFFCISFFQLIFPNFLHYFPLFNTINNWCMEWNTIRFPLPTIRLYAPHILCLLYIIYFRFFVLCKLSSYQYFAFLLFPFPSVFQLFN